MRISDWSSDVCSSDLFGGYLILSRSTSGTRLDGAAEMTMAERLADAQSVQLPYPIVAGVLVVLAIVIARFNLPALGTATRRAAAEERKHHSRSEEHTSELQSLMRI